MVRSVWDLTRPVENGMTVFPGDAPPEILCVSTVAEDGFRSSLIRLGSHTGTHIDAPAHIAEGGKSLDEFPVSDFFGTAAVADVRTSRGRLIEAGDIADVLALPVDFLLLFTGQGALWGVAEYAVDFPCLSLEAARLIAAKKLKGAGADTISFDPVDSSDCPVHKILLGAGVMLIENLALNLVPKGRLLTFAALPLLYRGSDGAPARAAAWETEQI